MEVLPPLNRAQLRQANAKMRRMTRRTPGLSGSSPFGTHFIDEATKGHKVGPGQYAGVTTALGLAISSKDLAKANKQDEIPGLMRRVGVLAQLYALMVTEQPRDRWYPLLADLTSFQLSEDTRRLAAKLAATMREDQALTLALSLTLFQGALGEALGLAQDPTVIGYRKAIGAFDRAIDDIKRESIRRAVEPKKLNGLGALGSVTVTKENSIGSCSLTDQFGGWTTAAKVNKARDYYRNQYKKEADPIFDRAVEQRNPCTDKHMRDLVNRYPPYPAEGGACSEPLKTGRDWITENCGELSNFTRPKIMMVQNAYRQATGKDPNNCSINYYTRSAICSVDTMIGFIRQKEAEGRPALGKAETERGEMYGGFSNWVKSNVGDALDIVIVQLKAMGKAASDLLCKAFNALFTGKLAAVGGVLCSIVKIVLGGAIDAIASSVAIMKTLFIGLAEFFVNLFKFSTEGLKNAAMALVKMTNTIVIILMGGTFSTLLGVPIVSAELTQAQKDEGIKSLEQLGAELPASFTIMLVAAVLGVILAPTPTSLSSLIVATTPAVVKFLAPALKRNYETFRDMAIDVIEKGVAVIIKIAAMVVAMVLSIRDVIDKFGNAVKRFWKRTISGPNAEEERQKLYEKFQKDFAKNWNNCVDKLKSGNMRGTMDGIKLLLTFIPDLLKAIVSDDPDLKEIVETGTKIFATAAAATAAAIKMWQDEFNAAPTDDQKMEVLRKQIEENKRQITDARRPLSDLCKRHPQNPACALLTDPVKVETKTVVVHDTQQGPQITTTTTRKKKTSAAPLALAAGGFLVGGPVGAAVGLVVGLVAGKKAAVA